MSLFQNSQRENISTAKTVY